MSRMLGIAVARKVAEGHRRNERQRERERENGKVGGREGRGAVHLIIFHNNALRRRAIINKAGVRNTRVHRYAARVYTQGERCVNLVLA